MQRTWWPEAGTIIVTGPYWAKIPPLGLLILWQRGFHGYRFSHRNTKSTFMQFYYLAIHGTFLGALYFTLAFIIRKLLCATRWCLTHKACYFRTPNLFSNLAHVSVLLIDTSLLFSRAYVCYHSYPRFACLEIYCHIQRAIFFCFPTQFWLTCWCYPPKGVCVWLWTKGFSIVRNTTKWFKVTDHFRIGTNTI